MLYWSNNNYKAKWQVFSRHFYPDGSLMYCGQVCICGYTVLLAFSRSLGQSAVPMGRTSLFKNTALCVLPSLSCTSLFVLPSLSCTSLWLSLQKMEDLWQWRSRHRPHQAPIQAGTSTWDPARPADQGKCPWLHPGCGLLQAFLYSGHHPADSWQHQYICLDPHPEQAYIQCCRWLVAGSRRWWDVPLHCPHHLYGCRPGPHHLSLLVNSQPMSWSLGQALYV